jgi:hypothetical protein
MESFSIWDMAMCRRGRHGATRELWGGIHGFLEDIQFRRCSIRRPGWQLVLDASRGDDEICERGLTGSRDACLEQSNHVLTGSSLWWRGVPKATGAEAPTTPGPGSNAQPTHRQKGSSAHLHHPPHHHARHAPPPFGQLAELCISPPRDRTTISDTSMDTSSSSSSASIQKTLVRLGGPLGVEA